MDVEEGEIIHLPPYPLPAKPLYKTEKCNGCGYCCHLSICALGERMFPNAQAPCPAIMYEEGRVRCGFILAEAEMLAQDPGKEPMLKNALGIDTYCDSKIGHDDGR